MSAEQRELFGNAPPRRAPRASAPPQTEPTPAPVWLQRLSLIVLVIFCFYIGGLLILLPWWGHYWQQNGWLMGHPALYNIFQQGWMRGIVSGLGFIDIWIGVSEVIHYRDYRA